VAHLEIAGHKHLLLGLSQVGQPQQVGGGAARAAHDLRRALFGEAEFLDEPMQALRLLQRAQVLALDVLDQRHRRGGFGVHLAHEHRYLGEASQASGRKRRSPAMTS
jgi:ABC-type taurine transport system ATPase subunit